MLFVHRLGWGTAKADIQAPVGYDGHGFGFRDVNGAKVHAGVREHYGIPFGVYLFDAPLSCALPPRLLPLSRCVALNPCFSPLTLLCVAPCRPW